MRLLPCVLCPAPTPCPAACCSDACLDEALFTSLADEPEPHAQGAVLAVDDIRAAPPSPAVSAPEAAATHVPRAGSRSSSPIPATAVAASVQPAEVIRAPAPDDLAAAAPAGRRKKVIRSRIGYARAATPAAIGEARRADSLEAALSPLAQAATPPAALARQASAGSAQSSGCAGPAPVPGTGLDPDLQQGSAAAESSDSLRGGAHVPAGVSRARDGDPLHLTALQQHVAQLDIRLELPPRPQRAGQPREDRQSDSCDSRRSTGAHNVLPHAGAAPLRQPPELCSVWCVFVTWARPIEG